MKYKQRSKKKDEGGRGEKSSSPDAVDSVDEYKRDQRRHNTGPDACKDGALLEEKATSDDLEPVQPAVKPEKDLEDYERKEKRHGKGQYSDSRQDAERKPKEKPSKGGDRVEKDKYRSPEGSDASDSRSEKTQKRKGENLERRSAEPQSSKCLKTNVSEVPQTCKSETQNPKAEKKKESKTRPPTESIWEGGAYVKSQKRISINISLNGKRRDEQAGKTENGTGKTKEELLMTNNGIEEKFKREGTEVNEKKDFSRDQEGEAKIKPDEREENPMWEEAATSNHKGLMREETAGQKKEEREEKDFDLWRCVLGDRGEEEEEESKNQCGGQSRMKVDSKEKMANNEVMMGGKEGGRRKDGGGQEMGGLVTWTQEEEQMGEDKLKMKKEEDTKNKSHPDGPNTTVDDDT